MFKEGFLTKNNDIIFNAEEYYVLQLPDSKHEWSNGANIFHLSL